LTALNKVPAVILGFWITKICATTLGETGGDLLSMTLNAGYALSSLILLGLFAVALLVQLRVNRYIPAVYWLVVLSTSTVGTTMSDYMDRSLGLGYAAGSLILAGLLVVVLSVWRLSVGSLSVSNISSLRSELFYWAAILVSNTLGTALGDYLADDSGLGFLGAAVLIGCVIACIALAYRLSRINRIALFWLAFVLTRPFGATFGDLLTKPLSGGGLGFGTVGASAILAVLLGILVIRETSRPVAPALK